jgi:hypothetical protein
MLLKRALRRALLDSTSPGGPLNTPATSVEKRRRPSVDRHGVSSSSQPLDTNTSMDTNMNMNMNMNMNTNNDNNDDNDDSPEWTDRVHGVLVRRRSLLATAEESEHGNTSSLDITHGMNPQRRRRCDISNRNNKKPSSHNCHRCLAAGVRRPFHLCRGNRCATANRFCGSCGARCRADSPGRCCEKRCPASSRTRST